MMMINMEEIINRGLTLLNKYQDLFNEYEINTPTRQAYFLATLATECKIIPINENLNYSSERLVVVFKKYFPTIETTKDYARNPQKIGNKVYANRMGNGNETTGDGFKYRGKGLIQLTGKANYQALSNYTKIDFVTNPDWLLQENFALLSALWFWKGAKCNDYVGFPNIVRKKINGGLNGLNEFLTYIKAFEEKLASN